MGQLQFLRHRILAHRTPLPQHRFHSIAAAANGVGLAFYSGATLADPQKILQGSGSQNRFVRLESAAMLEFPAIADLIRAAIKQSKVPLPASGQGKLIVRSVSAKQKPRRKA